MRLKLPVETELFIDSFGEGERRRLRLGKGGGFSVCLGIL